MTIFGQQQACIKCEESTAELCGLKKKLQDKEQQLQQAEKRINGYVERIDDLTSSLNVKKRMIDELRERTEQSAKRAKVSGELD